MTTNGLVLTKKLVSLQKAGLDVLNVSLDTLNVDKYQKVTRRKGWEHVMMGINLALQLGYNPVKINCVVMKGNPVYFINGLLYKCFEVFISNF